MAAMKLENSDFRSTVAGEVKEMTMKTTRISHSIGLGVALLSLTALPGNAQEFANADAKHNTAVAMSPRAQEAFPALARPAAVRPAAAATATAPNVAFNASPRAIEDFVELARPSRPANRRDGLTRRMWGVPLAANPRALEDNPELARQTLPAAIQPTFQVAPVK
jgi:hypothetical protein